MLNWQKDYDDSWNTSWRAESKRLAFWRLSQKLESDQIWWYESHDPELTDDCPCEWDNLADAKEYIQEQEDSL